MKDAQKASVKGGDTMSRTIVMTFRVNREEKDKISLLMKNNGYRSTSIFIRDLLLRKQIVSRREVVKVTDRQMRNQMNDITYQIKRLGDNYNQIVARYNAQSKMFHPDGRPLLNTESVNRTMEALRNITENVRDEVAVAIDIIKKYTEEPNINP